MGCGKSTAISALQKSITGATVFNVKFAQPLYDIQEYAYNRIKGAYSKPEGFVKDRKLLQWIGTEWGRDTISKSLWTDIWQKEVSFILNATDAVVVCDDVRFDNEAELIKSMGGKIIRISSDRGAEKAEGGVGIVNHSSEGGVNLKYVDYLVENNGSLEEYKYQLTYLYNKFIV